MDDLAPMEPGRGGARTWCGVVGLVFLALGCLAEAGLRPGGREVSTPSFSLAAAALLAAFTPRVPYGLRAVAMLMIGSTATALGLARYGPAHGIDAGGAGWGAMRAIAAAALPAALVFRSRYRAYAGARWLLVVAFAAALPFLGYLVVRLAVLDLGMEQIGGIAVLLAMAASLLGFMGSETTGAGAYLAGAVVLALTVDLALRGFASLGALSVPGGFAVVFSAIAFAASSALTTIGLFQVLAWRLATDARRINLHEPPKAPPRAREHSSADWPS